MLGESGTWQALRKSVSHILGSSTLQKLHMTVSHKISQIVHARIDVPGPLSVSGILTHHDTRSVILPYFSRALLLEIKAAK